MSLATASRFSSFAFRRQIAVAAAVLALALLLPVADATPGKEGRVTDQILLELKPGVPMGTIVQRYGVTVVDSIPQWLMWQVRVAPGDFVDDVVDRMNLDPDIDDAEPHRHLETPEGVQRSLSDIDLTVTTSAFRNQDAIVILGTTSAHTRSTGSGITVAVLDTGMAMAHPETSPRILGPGADFAGGDGTATVQDNGIDDDLDGLVDESSNHGTHVAGLVNLVAPDATVLPIRVLDSDGKGTAFGLTKGILHAIQSGVDVINLSIGMGHDSYCVERAIEEAYYAGIVVVASAGNRSLNGVDFPANLPEVIAVAVVNDTLAKSDFSSYGLEVVLSAPGVDLLSTHGNENYAHWSGTSFAAPLVAGAVALILEKNPGLAQQEVEDKLRSSAQPDNNPLWLDGLMGSGILDLDALTGPVNNDPPAQPVKDRSLLRFTDPL